MYNGYIMEKINILKLTQETREITANQKTEMIISLVKEISEKNEVFSFDGIDAEAYLRMKATEASYPGYTTPIDEIMERCSKEGIKVVFGKHPESGNVYVLPANSNDIEMDSIEPGQLLITSNTSEKLKELIEAARIKV